MSVFSLTVPSNHDRQTSVLSIITINPFHWSILNFTRHKKQTQWRTRTKKFRARKLTRWHTFFLSLVYYKRVQTVILKATKGHPIWLSKFDVWFLLLLLLVIFANLAESTLVAVTLFFYCNGCIGCVGCISCICCFACIS